MKIRLTRVGATKRPSYRVVAIDSRRPRDGRALEILGFYDPLTEPATVRLDRDKLQAWIGKGAKPSDTVVKLMRQDDAAAANKPADGGQTETTATASKATGTKAAARKPAAKTARPRSTKAADKPAAAAEE